MTTVPTRHLPIGEVVCTSGPVGTDFGLPLVEPVLTKHGRFYRIVRNRVRCRGGTVVWFTDGTKTPPLHGRTVWLLADPHIGDPREDTT